MKIPLIPFTETRQNDPLKTPMISDYAFQKKTLQMFPKFGWPQIMTHLSIFLSFVGQGRPQNQPLLEILRWKVLSARQLEA